MPPEVALFFAVPLCVICWFFTNRFKWFLMGIAFTFICAANLWYVWCAYVAAFVLIGNKDECLREDASERAQRRVIDGVEANPPNHIWFCPPCTNPADAASESCRRLLEKV